MWVFSFAHSIAVGLFIIVDCMVKLLEGAVGELNILNGIALTSTNMGKLKSPCADIVKIQVAYCLTFGFGVVAHLNIDGRLVAPVHHNAREGQVFNEGLFPTVVACVCALFGGELDGNSNSSIGHDDVGKGAVTDDAVVHPTDANAVGTAGQIAVDDSYFFAHLVFGKRTAVGTNYDAVVSARDERVGNGYVSATVDMNAVIVGIVQIGKDFDAGKIHIVAVVNPI